MNFNITSINTSFAGLVGFNQTIDSDYPTYEADLIQTDSGLTIDDHPLFKIDVLYSCLPDFEGMTLGSGVTSEDAYNDYIRQKYQYAQSKLINKLFSLKKVNGQSKELFQDVRLFDNTKDLTQLTINNGSFVGLEIMLDKMDGLALQITRIGTHFNQAVTVPIYLYNYSNQAYVSVDNIAHATANSYQWTNYSKKIYYNGSTYQPGGRYAIGYFQDDLGSAQAIQQNIDFDNLCYACSYWNRTWHGLYSRYMTVRNIIVGNGNLNGTNFWMNPNYAGATSANFGLNLDISVVSDLTQFFVKNKNVLAYPLKLQIQVDLLQEMYNSVRDTKRQEDVMRKIEIELSTDNRGGIMSEYLDAMKGLDFDYSALGSYSLNSNKRGIKIKPV